MAESERGGGELVRHGRVDSRVVVVRVAEPLGKEPEVEHVPRAEDQREPLVVRDVDHLGRGYLLGLLVQLLVVPARVERLELGRDSVVLAEPDQVDQGQARLLVDPAVTWTRRIRNFIILKRFCLRVAKHLWELRKICEKAKTSLVKITVNFH